MSREILLEALNGINDRFITEAAEVMGLLNESAPMAGRKSRARRESTFARFFGSGWGVAVICAAVSLSVLSGIIWAGQRPPAGGPGGTEHETETIEYSGESQDEVTIRHGDTVIYPKKFFLWSESDGVSADGEGFAGTIQIDYNGIPVLPKVYYAKDGSISPCELNLTTGYEFSFVRIYDTDMQQSGVTYDGPFNYKGFLSVLPVGRYYIALQIKHNSSCYEYAYELVVMDTTASGIISEERAMEIASDHWGIQTGDIDPDTGYTFRIESLGQSQTPDAKAVYEIALRWLVDDSHYSTLETVWVDMLTGEVIIPYEDTATETETQAHVHAFGDWSVVLEPTCTAKGTQERTCPCGETQSQDVYPTGHAQVSIPAVPPTTTEPGLSEGKQCSVCGKVLVAQGVVDPLGHTDLAYEINEDGRTCTITGMGTCTATEIYIPSAIDGYKVTRIGEIAFYEKPITAVHFPSSITEICDGAFYGCAQLTEITLPRTITSLGYQVFQYCTALTTATIQCNIDQLPTMLFDGCTALSEVNLPGGLSSIGMNAFANCTSLQTITLPSDLGAIGVGAFQGCTALSDITIPSRLSILDDDAFVGCTGLTGEIVLPDSLVRIGSRALGECSGITAITVPRDVKQSEPDAFERMEGLTDIYFRGTEAEWNAIGYVVGEDVQIHFGA